MKAWSNGAVFFLIALLLGAPADAEILQLTVDFEDSGCLPCTESLQQRLERVRGVTAVSLDLEQRRVSLELEPRNRARLAPVLARITQDGTKIVELRARIRGRVADGAFVSEGIAESYRIESGPSDAQADTLYEASGTLTPPEAPGQPATFAITSLR